jgi:hypothetical protein
MKNLSIVMLLSLISISAHSAEVNRALPASDRLVEAQDANDEIPAPQMAVSESVTHLDVSRQDATPTPKAPVPLTAPIKEIPEAKTPEVKLGEAIMVPFVGQETETKNLVCLTSDHGIGCVSKVSIEKDKAQLELIRAQLSKLPK